MKKHKLLPLAAGTALAVLLAACSNNNTDAVHNERDTNLLDSRRYTDTTGNYITKDSAGLNTTPAREGTGLDQ